MFYCSIAIIHEAIYGSLWLYGFKFHRVHIVAIVFHSYELRNNCFPKQKLKRNTYKHTRFRAQL